MSFQKTPSGTRGRRMPKANALTRFVMRMMIRQHRRKGDRFGGMDLLYLTTKGAKTGEARQSALTYFADGADAWLVIASAGGAAQNPGWYHNIAAHPDDVWIEVGGRRFRVTVEQLDGDARETAWQRLSKEQPRYAGYQEKTDRLLPVLRFTRAES